MKDTMRASSTRVRRPGRRSSPSRSARSRSPAPARSASGSLLSPIHNHDLWTVRGTYGFKPELPAQAGTEALGVVDALGDGVDQLTVGQRVVTGGTFGVWAEYFVARAAGLIPVPEALPDEAAAQLVSMPFSAISLLRVARPAARATGSSRTPPTVRSAAWSPSSAPPAASTWSAWSAAPRVWRSSAPRASATSSRPTTTTGATGSPRSPAARPSASGVDSVGGSSAGDVALRPRRERHARRLRRHGVADARARLRATSSSSRSR